MAAVTLTDKFIQSATVKSNRQEIADAGVRGHYLVIQPTGAKSFAVRYRLDGKAVKQTIGSYPKVSLKDSREEARRILAAVDEGGDPQAEARIANDDFLIKNVFEDFLKRYVEKNNAPNVAKRRRKIFEAEILPAWGNRHVAEIKRRDVVKFIDEIIDRDAPVQANRTFSFLKKFFNWCIDRDVIEHSPMNRMKEPSDEESRERVLTEDEIRLVWHAAEKEGYPFGPAIQLLILSAQRRQEVGGARRQEFGGSADFGSNLPVWTIPKGRTKNRKSDHVVPLTEWMDQLFSSQPVIAGDFDFIFTNFQKKASTGWSKCKERMDAAILKMKREEAEARGEDASKVQPMNDWRFHDLRRTAATFMASNQIKVLPHVIEAVLNHKSGAVKGVAGIYNRYQYFEEKLEALTKWEAVVRRIVFATSNVVTLPLKAS